MLKADLHLHTKEDPLDKLKIDYTAKELIDYMKKLDFDVIAITNHNSIFYNKKIKEYAKKKGILLIPGVEATIEGKHILIYNPSLKEKLPKTFSELEKYKRKNKKSVIVAAHPFFPMPQLYFHNLEKYIELFDAVEYSHFYTKRINFNKRAVKIAKKHNKPFLGTSDAHFLDKVGTTYSLLKCQKTKASVLEAIKKGNLTIITEPIRFLDFATRLTRSNLRHISRNIYKLKNRKK
ncbi:PHP domain-containing protein [Nanoarchaeota archaeon]